MGVGFKRVLGEGLAACPLRDLDCPHDGEAAVLIPVYEKSGRPHLLLTLRSQDVATHKGQVSFPGGVSETQDASLEETALRETEEEVGLARDRVTVLGRFHQYLSVTDLLVTPFVGYLEPGFSLTPNVQEVERILEVPFDFLRKTEPRRQPYVRFGRPGTLYYYDFEGEVIWGLTAAMIRDLLELADF